LLRVCRRSRALVVISGVDMMSRLRVILHFSCGPRLDRGRPGNVVESKAGPSIKARRELVPKVSDHIREVVLDSACYLRDPFQPSGPI
jgi:hypothetical protein